LFSQNKGNPLKIKFGEEAQHQLVYHEQPGSQTKIKGIVSRSYTVELKAWRVGRVEGRKD
jgi:hypothetical protein